MVGGIPAGGALDGKDRDMDGRAAEAGSETGTLYIIVVKVIHRNDLSHRSAVPNGESCLDVKRKDVACHDQIHNPGEA